jgi:hypothetical protein
MTSLERRRSKAAILTPEEVRLIRITHGMRSMFRDFAAEQTSYGREVAEIALAHQVGSKVEQAYLRTDLLVKRRALMRDWANWCAITRKPATVMALDRNAARGSVRGANGNRA